jgi:DNA-binding transcriptional LysR family regulator
VEPDLQGMRAFTVAAEELHFGRAAAKLFLTQQALSKRIRRLEQALGVPLFKRTTRRVELTPAGQRFLPLAKQALAAYDTAISSVIESPEPLRIEVNAERFTPLKVLRDAARRVPDLRIEPSMRQGLAIALPAVQNGELDAAFGRVHDLGRPWPTELAHRPVHIVEMHAFVLEGHAFAERTALTLADLQEAGISMPDPGGAHEWRAYLQHLSQDFAIPLRFTEPAVGVRHYGEQMAREDRAIAIGEAETDLPHDMRIRRIPLVDPTPLHVWSIVWHRHNRHPLLASLLKALPTPSSLGPGTWLPEPERTSLKPDRPTEPERPAESGASS